jgi:hypothetical protein
VVKFKDFSAREFTEFGNRIQKAQNCSAGYLNYSRLPLLPPPPNLSTLSSSSAVPLSASFASRASWREKIGDLGPKGQNP